MFTSSHADAVGNDSVSNVRTHWQYTERSFKFAIIFSVFFGFILMMVQLGTPLLSMQIFDRVIPSGQISTLIALAGILVLLTLICTVIDGSRGLMLARCGQQISWSIEGNAERAILGNVSYGNVMEDIDCLRHFTSSSLIVSFLDLPWSMAYLISLGLIHPALGFYTLVSFVAVAIIPVLTQPALRRQQREVQALESQAGTLLNNASRERTMLTALGTMSSILRNLSQVREDLLTRHEMLTTKNVWINASGRTLRSILQIGILGLATTLTLWHEANAGAIIASSMLFTRAISPIERLSSASTTVLTAHRAWRRLATFSRTYKPSVGSLSAIFHDGHVVAAGLTVLRPDSNHPIIQEISLEAFPGSISVIIGAEGSGKSVLAAVLCGAIKPDRGSVQFDGLALHKYNEEDLARYVGYLPQFLPFKQGAIVNLISRGLNASHAAIVDAARLAGADDFIRALPFGYQTEIGMDRLTLSMGQMRRLALARALYGDPKLVVLDDPFSGLDDDGEQRVTAAIKSLKSRGSSVVVVSKNTRLLNVADKYFFLQEGRLRLKSDASAMRTASVSRLAPP